MHWCMFGIMVRWTAVCTHIHANDNNSKHNDATYTVEAKGHVTMSLLFKINAMYTALFFFLQCGACYCHINITKYANIISLPTVT